MNCEQINKELPIKEAVEHFGNLSNGIQRPSGVFYLSPFRPDDKKPSFKISTNENLWIDYGLLDHKRGGTVIDFIMMVKNCHVKTALGLANDYMKGTRVMLQENVSFSFHEQKEANFQHETKEKKEKSDSPTLEIIKINDEIKNFALIKYIESRNIDLSLANQYLKEVYFANTIKNKNYFSVGMQNDSGGWELRNKYIPTVIGEKDITSIGIDKKTSQIALFEGYFDFLSYLSDTDEKKHTQAYIVLNSANLINRATEKTKPLNIKQILAYLDNDNAGYKAIEILKDQFSEKVLDMSSAYNGFNDYNEYWKT